MAANVIKFGLMGLLLSLMMGCGGSIDPDLPREISQQIVKQEYAYARLGMILGFGLVIVGVILIVSGITMKTDIVATFSDGSINMPDAPIGLALVIAGLIFVYITKPRITTNKRNE